MNIQGHIKALLFLHDCVIIPGFGGLVGNLASASADIHRDRFSPPFKRIGFNVHLSNNDGLLASEVANAEHVSYDEAQQAINEFVKGIKRALNTEGVFVIHEVGTFVFKETGMIRFEPCSDINFALSSYGLEIFNLPKLEVLEEPIAQPQIEPKKEIIEFNSVRPPVFEVLKYAAMLLAISYSAWVMLGTDLIQNNDRFVVADLNPFGDKICLTYQTRSVVKEVLDMPGEEDYFGVAEASELFELMSINFFDKEDREFDDSEFIVVRLKEAVRDNTFVARVRKSRFHVIGGCFGVESNAKKYINSLLNMGYQASILDIHKGLFRVSIQGFESKIEALSELEEIRINSGTSAWILQL